MGILRPFKEARAGALLVTLWAIWGLAFALGEVIPVSEGLGWDGVRFGKMVEGGPSLLFDREINSYYVQRVGPSFAVRVILKMAGADFEAPSIRLGFVAWNLALLSVALVLMMDVAHRVGLGSRGRWVLFLGLFANLPNGRLPVYYAPIGDSTAFFLGTLVLWAYIAGRPLVMVAAFLLAVVSWPAAFLLLPMLLWPRAEPRGGRAPEPASLSSASSALVRVMGVPLGLGLLALVTWSVAMPEVSVWSKEAIVALGTNSLQLGCAAGFFAALALANVHRLRSWPSVFGLVAAAALMAISALYVRTFESGSLAFSGATFLREILLFARSGAFAALVGHAAYYSALAVAAVAVWPQVLRAALGLGPGAFFCAGLTGLLALDAESRRLNAFWPLVGLLTVMALERLWSDRAHFVAFAAAALAMSKLWWPLTGPPLFSARHDPGNYFNTQGPSMSEDAILVHSISALALGFWIALRSAAPAKPGEGSVSDLSVPLPERIRVA